jgi:Protein of unknown function, DUF547
MRARPAGAALVLAVLAGCSTNVPPPGASGQAGQAPPTTEAAEASWNRVLQTHVDDQGRIDFAGLTRDRADLDTYVAWVAAVSPASSPDSFGTPEARLAYSINAYNALAMYNVVRSGLPLRQPSDKVRFFYSDKLLVGGTRLSLYAFENDVIRPLGDPRIHFALNCMVKSCPRLPREPFAPERLEAQLDAAAREFLNDRRNVDPFPPKRVVRLSMILNWYEKDFLAKAPNLAAYVDGYRPEPIPAGYEIEFIEYDWALNAQ